MKLIKYILIFWLIINYANAQQVFVISKKIEKTVAAQQYDTLTLQTEKAHINIIGWDHEEIQLTLKLESKHPKKDIASRDLEYHHYTISKKGKAIMVKNYFYASDNYYAIKSNLSATYTLYVPNHMAVKVNGSYGSLKVQYLDGRLEVSGKFLDVSMERMNGSVIIHSEYGDVHGTSISDFQAVTAKSDVFLQAVMNCNISSEYGSIEIAPLAGESSIRIDAQKTSVKFLIPDADRFDYNLSTSFADIILPTSYQSTVSKTVSGIINFKRMTGKNTLLEASTSYSSISVVEVANKTK